MVGVAKGTVLRLLAEVGTACSRYHQDNVRGLTCVRVQCDEIWSFCHAKERNIKPYNKSGQIGDVWTWVGIDSETKLVISYLCGQRTPRFARWFAEDLANRIDSHVQISTDGLNMYAQAIPWAFGHRADLGQEVKEYGSMQDPSNPDARYSPSFVKSIRRTRVYGAPDPEYISTAHVERQNLTMRMSMRRFTRLTNAFSKKLENHRHALALHFMYYNFCRPHLSLRATPAIHAGLTKRIWTLHDLASLPDILRDSSAA
ncbi:MAG TPA: IS1 family transposase [Candidatus Acidoferrales bacterium]|nr:IS1 family transposase [Candidatus Acidoferrales bacterium]